MRKIVMRLPEITYRRKPNKINHSIHKCINLDVDLLVPFLFYGIQVFVRILVDERYRWPLQEICSWQSRGARDITLRNGVCHADGQGWESESMQVVAEEKESEVGVKAANGP